MLKKLGSDLLYLVLKTIDRLDDPNVYGYVVNPEYLSIIDDRLIEATDEELEEIKKELLIELDEGDYTESDDFLNNMDEVFNAAHTQNLSNSVLYQVIKECFNKVYESKNS